MTLDEIKRAYRYCIKWRHSKGKGLNKNQLDKILYVVEKYIRWMEDN